MDRRIEDPVVKLMHDTYRVLQQLGDRIWTDEYLPTLHQLEDAAWDEYRGVSGVGAPHKLTRTELYDLLAVKLIKSVSVPKPIDGARKWAKGFYRKQFEPVWSAMGGVTAAQPSKIISLPRYKKHLSDGTDTDTREE
jgi:hypothetical protein